MECRASHAIMRRGRDATVNAARYALRKSPGERLSSAPANLAADLAATTTNSLQTRSTALTSDLHIHYGSTRNNALAPSLAFASGRPRQQASSAATTRRQITTAL